jgi:phospholipid/cholesterol/gamma-HCH transport system substrate-binding protein
METQGRYVLVGSFVLLLLAALVVVVLWLARFEFRERVSFYDIYFEGSVAGLNQGSAVRDNGIAVGRVAEIRLDPRDPTRVRVTVEIQAGTIIRTNAVASLETQGLTGGAYINITGGSRNAPPIERQVGERYPVIASAPSGLQRVVSSAPEALARLIALTNQLSDLLRPANREAIAQTLENMRRLTATVASHTGEIDSAITDSTASLHALRSTLETAQAVLASLNLVLAPGGDMATAIESFNETSKRFGAVADQLNARLAAGGDIAQTVRSVNETARKFADVADRLDGLLAANGPELRDFGRDGLAQIEQLVVQTQALVTQLSRIADGFERDPSQIIYGDRRQGYRPQ